MRSANSNRRAALSTAEWHAKFLEMLPTIEVYVSIAFNRLRGDARDEAMQEVVVHCLVAFVRLVERGKVESAFPTVLVKYAVAQYHDGRRVAGRPNCRDLTSTYARRSAGIEMESLNCFDKWDREWWDAMLVDRRARPADVAALRIDFAEWLRLLPARTRKIALALAQGGTTNEVARVFHLSDGRISQLRRWLMEHWFAFQGEPLAPAAACA